MRISDWSSDVCSSDLFLDRGLVVVHAGLEVVAGDFLQRQEAVAVCAVLDEGGFERGFEPGDAALVDVGLLLFLRRLHDIEIGRASCRERVCQYVYIAVGAVTLTKK